MYYKKVIQIRLGLKAQVSMENIMAYGSTLLVILLGVGALDYMGVFNLGDLLPDKCTFAGNVVGCDEFVVYSNLVGLELSNKLGRNVEVTSITVTGDEITPETGCSWAPTADNPGRIAEGDRSRFIVSGGGCTINLPVGSKIKGEINLRYRRIGLETERTIIGTINAHVEGRVGNATAPTGGGAAAPTGGGPSQ